MILVRLLKHSAQVLWRNLHAVASSTQSNWAVH
jgi:hypothetical protein